MSFHYGEFSDLGFKVRTFLSKRRFVNLKTYAIWNPTKLLPVKCASQNSGNLNEAHANFQIITVLACYICSNVWARSMYPYFRDLSGTSLV